MAVLITFLMTRRFSESSRNFPAMMPLLLPEAQEKAIRDIPRDAEIVALFNKLAGNDPLPPR